MKRELLQAQHVKSQRAAPGGEALPGLALKEHQVFQTRRHRAPLLWVVAFALLALSASYHSLIYLPQPDHPHRLTALDDLFAFQVVGLIAVGGLVLGWRLLRWFALPGFSRPERAALAIGLGWGLLSFGVLLLGLAHVLYPGTLPGLVALILLVNWRTVWQALGILLTGKTYRILGSARPHGLLEKGAALFVLLEVCLPATQALTFPYDQPYGYDLYQYHWAVPKLYLLHQAIIAFPGWAHANFPFNTEMLNILALAVDAPAAALLIQMSFGLFAVLLLAGYLYRHVGRTAAWLGAALCLSSPAFAGLLSNGYSELGLSFYTVAALVVALAYVERSIQTGAPALTRWLCLAGLLAGVGLGVKYTGGQVVLGMGVLLVGSACVAGLRAWRQREPLWPLVKRWLWALSGFGACALLALLPWLLKDWVLLGNPIYPFVWGGPGWDAARTQVGVISLGNFGPHGPLWQRLLLAFWGLFFDARLPGEDYFLPLNYLLLAALVLPLARLLKTALPWRKRAVAAGKGAGSLAEGEQAEPKHREQWKAWWLVIGVAYVVWVLSGATVARYAVPWAILLTVPAALVLARLYQRALRVRVARVLFQPAILSLLLVLGPLLSLRFWLFDNPLSLLAGQVSLQQWQRQHLMDPGYWAMVDYVNSQLPSDARLLLIGRGAGYFIENHDYVGDSGEDWIPYLETEGRTPAGMIALLKQNGFRYLVYEETTLRYVIQTYQNTYLASFLPAFRQFLSDSLTRIWSYQNFAIYRI